MGQGQGLLECGERLHRPAAEGGGGDAQSRRDLLVRVRVGVRIRVRVRVRVRARVEKRSPGKG